VSPKWPVIATAAAATGLPPVCRGKTAPPPLQRWIAGA